MTASLREFSRSLPMALLRAREAVMSEFRPMLRSYGLTEQQWRVLRALAESKGLEISELSETCFILAPSLSRILQSMQNRGLIERIPVANDQRKTLITISAEGLKLVRRVAPDAEAHYELISAKIGAANIDRLYKLLARVEGSAKK